MVTIPAIGVLSCYNRNPNILNWSVAVHKAVGSGVTGKAGVPYHFIES